jgi:hypothetical protein
MVDLRGPRWVSGQLFAQKIARLIFVPFLIVFLTTAARPEQSRAQTATGQFLLISDLHFDPFYDGSLFAQLQARPVEQWGAVLETSQPTGFNPRGTDSNHALVRSSLDDARARIPRPDFILYPGDSMAHQWQAKYDALAPASHMADPAAYHVFTTKAIRFLAGEMAARFPGIAILPTLGNDDSYCGDYMIEPQGPFLRMFADAWAPLVAPDRESVREAFRRSFARGGYFTVALPGTSHVRLVVLNSIFFSLNYENACGKSTQTPSLDELRWLAETLEQAQTAREPVWMLTHIPPGINAYNSAESVAQGGPPQTFWQQELTARFLQLADRYAATMQLGFVGHTHMDDFRVVRRTGEPALLLKIAPAVSPIYGNNPGYQIYQYDRERGTVLNYQTFYLTNHPAKAAVTAPGGPPAASSPRPPAPGQWALEYDFRQAYGFDGVNARNVAQLVDRMRSNVTDQQHYTAYYGVSGPHEISGQTLDVYRCAIGHVTPADFLRSLKGEPKPRRSRLYPDRRPRATLLSAP